MHIFRMRLILCFRLSFLIQLELIWILFFWLDSYFGPIYLLEVKFETKERTFESRLKKFDLSKADFLWFLNNFIFLELWLTFSLLSSFMTISISVTFGEATTGIFLLQSCNLGWIWLFVLNEKWLLISLIELSVYTSLNFLKELD